MKSMVSFHVLRCANCETFQVQQVTKSQTWKCKLCGQKQSTIKVYGEGTGAECRRHVQKLNTLRVQIDEQRERTQEYVQHAEDLHPVATSNYVIPKEQSWWSQFVEEKEGVQNENEDNAAPQSSHNGVYMTTDRVEYNKRKKEIKTENLQRKYKKFEISSHERFPVKAPTTSAMGRMQSQFGVENVYTSTNRSSGFTDTITQNNVTMQKSNTLPVNRAPPILKSDIINIRNSTLTLSDNNLHDSNMKDKGSSSGLMLELTDKCKPAHTSIFCGSSKSSIEKLPVKYVHTKQEVQGVQTTSTSKWANFLDDEQSEEEGSSDLDLNPDFNNINF